MTTEETAEMFLARMTALLDELKQSLDDGEQERRDTDSDQ